MIGLINYGMGNLGSVRRTFEILNIDNKIINNSSEISNCEKLVLPGVGNFSNAMKILNNDGWSKEIINHTINKKKPLLGICLGMQLLAKTGTEGEVVDGLGLIDGTVKTFNFNNNELRIPHVGWNSLESLDNNSRLLNEIEQNTDFYFVHSYYLETSPQTAAASTNYGIDFCSVVEIENIFGTQFHPEKSSRSGRKILENFSKI
tara:strand:- start:760 stop:1371 length:612 start_codon:yes stop_codon:yes gene_type:complete